MRRFIFLSVWCLMAFAAGAAEVAFAPDGMLTIDGERTFLVGLYENPEDDAVLDAAAEAGFDIVRCGGSAECLDRLHARGLYAWVNTGGRIDLGADGNNPDTGLREVVDAVGKHPALAIWEVPDEVLWGCWLRAYAEADTWTAKFDAYRKRFEAKHAGLLAGYKALKTIDPHHPIWMNHAPCNSREDLAAFNQAADIVGCDIYPILELPFLPGDESRKVLGYVGRYTQFMQSAAPEKPVWMVLQGFGWGDLGAGPMTFPLLWETHQNRRPTAEEFRYMNYSAIARGARAVLYWGTHRVEKESALWKSILEVVRELDGRRDLLSAPDAALQPELDTRLFVLAQPNGVALLGKQMDDGIWWLAVNELSFPLRYTMLGIEELDGMTYVDVDTGRETKVRRGRASFSIPGYGVQILRPAPKTGDSK